MHAPDGGACGGRGGCRRSKRRGRQVSSERIAAWRRSRMLDARFARSRGGRRRAHRRRCGGCRARRIRGRLFRGLSFVRPVCKPRALQSRTSRPSRRQRVLQQRVRVHACARGSGCGKRVMLVPDSFYLCHLEIVRLLERSFERADEALRFGQRAVEMAPTVAAGFCRLGRAYMLVGDMEKRSGSADGGLADCRAAERHRPFVLPVGRTCCGRRANRAQARRATVKSLSASSAFVLQASAELQELVEETGEALPGHGEVDAALARADIPVAPTEEVLEALGAGAAAATDAGAFVVARSLLSLRLRYRPDDALVNVLRSLEVGSA